MTAFLMQGTEIGLNTTWKTPGKDTTEGQDNIQMQTDEDSLEWSPVPILGHHNQ